MTAAFAPPNAELVHSAWRTGCGRGLPSATGSTGQRGRGRVWCSVGGIAPRRIASSVAMISSTPAAPCAWPRKLFVALTGRRRLRSPNAVSIARHSAASLAAVPVPWAFT